MTRGNSETFLGNLTLDANLTAGNQTTASNVDGDTITLYAGGQINQTDNSVIVADALRVQSGTDTVNTDTSGEGDINLLTSNNVDTFAA